ncbi:MAG: hypothetical protein HKN23_00245 [Verrucomicrobiales bacterium]|nr:hypothetical protein [Verrucomicrobiales bacterium]
MRFPALTGLIRRRLLVNFRADPDVVVSRLPDGMKPKLSGELGMVGVCLIRLEKIRPRGIPFFPPITSENAAYRFAVTTNRGEDAVYIPRRETSSLVSHLAGGRVFPGEHHFSRFEISDSDGEIEFSMTPRSGAGSVIHIRATETDRFPDQSLFSDLAAASAFFKTGSRGYSKCVRRPECLDCIDLKIADWQASALDVKEVRVDFFESGNFGFPSGSVEFDHALLMRDIPHEWQAGEDWKIE